MSSASELLGSNTFYSHPSRNRIRDVKLSSSAIDRMHQRLRERKHRQQINVQQAATTAPQSKSLSSFMVAPKYLNRVAKKKTNEAVVDSAFKRPAVYQYSRITRPDSITNEDVVETVSPVAAVYSGQALESFGDRLSHIYEAFKERLHLNGKLADYSVVEGATAGWWLENRRTVVKIAVPLVVVAVVLGGVLLSASHIKQPAVQKTPTAVGNKAVSHDISTGSNDGAANPGTDQSASNGTTSGSAASVQGVSSPTTAIPQSSASATTVPNTSSQPVGGMGGGPSGATNPGTTPAPVSFPDILGTNSVSVPPQTIGVGGTPLVTTPSVDATVN